MPIDIQVIRDLLSSMRLRPPGGRWQFIWNKNGLPPLGGIGFTFYVDFGILRRAAIQTIRSLPDQLMGNSVEDVQRILKEFFYDSLANLDTNSLFFGFNTAIQNALDATPSDLQERLRTQLDPYISNQMNDTLYLVTAIGIPCPEPILSRDVIWISGDAELNGHISTLFNSRTAFMNGQFPPFETNTRTSTLSDNDSLIGCLAKSESDADSKIRRVAGAISMALQLPKSRTFTMAEAPKGRIALRADGSWSFRVISSVFPPLFRDILTTRSMVNMIRGLLVDYTHDPVMHRRILIALEYVEAGWVPLGRLGFLHNAIAIDALFGEDGRVRRSILDGLSRHANEIINITRRGELIYGIRCDLMHGSAQTLELCPNYLTYYDEFDIDPALDQLFILRTCLWNLSGVSES